jgi:hypothetical protein
VVALARAGDPDLLGPVLLRRGRGWGVGGRQGLRDGERQQGNEGKQVLHGLAVADRSAWEHRGRWRGCRRRVPGLMGGRECGIDLTELRLWGLLRRLA